MARRAAARNAEDIVFARCSEQPCWLFAFSCSTKQAIERINILRQAVINNCISHNQSTQSKTNALLEILRHKLMKRKRPSGQHAWMIDVSLPEDEDVKLVCQKCFCNLHGISISSFARLVKDLKDCELMHIQPGAEIPNMYTTSCRDKLIELGRHSGHIVAHNEELVAAIPNTVAALQAGAWFRNYYKAVGDVHLDGSYTLELPSIKQLHDTYKSQCASLTEVRTTFRHAEAIYHY
jgi:hypothetical protein